MQDDFRGFRRFPAEEKKVRDISTEDGRVSIIGTLIDKEEGKMTVDDGTGSIEVVFDGDVSVKVGKTVRVIGKVSQDGFITGEAVQDFSGFNIQLYKEISSK